VVTVLDLACELGKVAWAMRGQRVTLSVTTVLDLAGESAIMAQDA